MIKKFIDKVIARMVAVDEDKTPLKLQKVKVDAEFKIPLLVKAKITGEFEMKKDK